MSNLYFSSFSLLISLITIFAFFYKKNNNQLETRINSYLVILTLLKSIFMCVYSVLFKIGVSELVLSKLMKFNYILVLLIMWVIFIFIVSLFSKKCKILKPIILVTAIYNVIVIFLIISFSVDISTKLMDNATLAVLVASAIYAIMMIVSIIISLKNDVMNFKRYLMLVVVIVLVVMSITIRAIFPPMNIDPLIFSYITLVIIFINRTSDASIKEKLAIVQEQAVKSNNVKIEFLSNMSHEIRTPLNAIVGFSQSIQDADSLEAAKEDALDILEASYSLLDIVGGVLDISKMEANNLKIKEKEYNIYELLEKVVKLIQSKLGEKDIKFSYKFSENIPTKLFGDEKRIKQCILNVLVNAVKYTDHGFVTLNVESELINDTCNLVITVEDSGIGIEEEDFEKIFNKFERLSDDYETRSGVGLGLAITKQLLNMMNGKILVQSRVGKGSKFIMTFSQRVVKLNTNVNKNIAITAKLEGKRVLLVDDNKINLKVAKRLLENESMLVVDVLSGMECVNLIKKGEQFDLVLLDIMMPDMDGIETLSSLHSINDFDVPVVAVTADAVDGMREKYIEAGFDEYIPKPIDKQLLKEVLIDLLNK